MTSPMKLSNKLICFLTGVCAVFSCTPDDRETLASTPGQLSASVMLEGRIRTGTKSYPVTGTDEMYDCFNLFEYIYAGSMGDASHYKETMRREKNSMVWKSDGADYIPVSSEYKTFYWALAPADADGVTFNGPSTGGNPQFSYLTPEDVSLQKDLMLAISGPNEGRPSDLVLPFRHLLSGIQFRVGDVADESTEAVNIKSVVIRDVYTAADYMIPSDGADKYGKWVNYSRKDDRMLLHDMKYAPSTSGTIYGGDDTMMLLPQTLTSSSRLDVILEDGSTISSSLAGVRLEQGKINMLTLDWLSGLVISGDNVIDVTQTKLYDVIRKYSDGTDDRQMEGLDFISTDPSVAAFEGNRLTGIKPGSTIIYVTKGGMKSNELNVTVSPYVLRYAVGGFPGIPGSAAQELSEPAIFYGESLFGRVFSGNTPIYEIPTPLTDIIQKNDTDVVIGNLGRISELQQFDLKPVKVTGLRRYVTGCRLNDIHPRERDVKPGFTLYYNDETYKKTVNGSCDCWYYKDQKLDPGCEYDGWTSEGDYYSIVVTAPFRVSGRTVADGSERYYNYVH